MQVKEQPFFADVIPPRARNLVQADTTPRSRRDARQPDDDVSATSFSHLLVERRQRLHDRSSADVQPRRAAESVAGEGDRPQTDAKTRLDAAEVTQPLSTGATATTLPAAVALATGEFKPNAVVAPDGAADQPPQGDGAPSVLVQAGQGTKAGDELGTEAAQSAPAADPADVITAMQTPQPGAESQQVTVSQQTPQTPPGAEPRPAGSMSAVAATHLPAEAAPPGRMPAPAVSPETTTSGATGDLSVAPPVPEASVAANPATAEPAVAAVTMESAAKGQAVYTKIPVVGEAQLVADSLKQEERGTQSAPSGVVAAVAAIAELATGSLAERSGSDQQSSPSQSTPADAASPATNDGEPTSPVPGTEAPETAALSELPLKLGSVEHSAAKTTPSAEANQATAESVAATSLQTAGTTDAIFHQSAGKMGADALLARQVHSQVVKHLNTHVGQITGQERVTIKLNPESLGQIELNFESRDDHLSVVITATTNEAGSALRENIKDLTDRIVDRSSRFSHVEVRVELRENNEARQDGKPDQKQEGRQEQRRGQNGQSDRQQQREQSDQQGRQAHQARESWENAMSWQLADEAVAEEG